MVARLSWRSEDCRSARSTEVEFCGACRDGGPGEHCFMESRCPGSSLEPGLPTSGCQRNLPKTGENLACKRVHADFLADFAEITDCPVDK